MTQTAIFLLLLGISIHVSASSVPNKFFGAWEVEKSENFDEYLSAKGVNWFLRKIIQMATITKIFDQKADNTLIVENRSSKGNIKWEKIHLGKEFEGKGMDGTIHKITFNYVNGELTERHIRTYEGKKIDETYSYTVEDGKLVLKLTEGSIVARRWFKRVPLPKD